MSHSKRNTSSSLFTAHERQLLRSAWGSQTARLSSDAVLPFASCLLCLRPARDPVCCPGTAAAVSTSTSQGRSSGEPNTKKRKRFAQTHIFCRGCLLSNLLAQKTELRRLAREQEARRAEDEEQRSREEVTALERDVKEFEDAQVGLSRRITQQDRSRKRPREDGGPGDDDGRKKKDMRGFWGPSEYPNVKSGEADGDLKKKDREKTLCPGSSEEAEGGGPHACSLKSLVEVRFTLEDGTGDKKSDAGGVADKTRVCPACSKPLTNSSRALLARPCGHVVCGGCAERFVLKGSDDDTVGDYGGGMSCFVCSEALGDGHATGKEKKKDKSNRGLFEVVSEGTGYAGGGRNVVKKSGLSFQC